MGQRGKLSGAESEKMGIFTGEIAKGDNRYIIRGKQPAEIFTVLNPEPDILDKYAKNGETVK